MIDYIVKTTGLKEDVVEKVIREYFNAISFETKFVAEFRDLYIGNFRFNEKGFELFKKTILLNIRTKLAGKSK